MKPYRVLIVDDNVAFKEAFRTLIACVLGKRLTILDEAGDGKEALDKLQVNRYDYIFMDVNMPVLNGISAAMEIDREYSRSTKIIALSFQNDMQTITRMISSGARDFLYKGDLTFERLKAVFD
jgi:CheY-like chemotaxis protein